MFLLATFGLEGVDVFRMALQLIPKEFVADGYYQRVAAVASITLKHQMSEEGAEMIHALVKQKLGSFLRRNGTPGSYGEEIDRLSQVRLHELFRIPIY